MPQVGLDEQEWNQVMGLLAQAPWREVNTLLMKIGAQLRQQAELKANLNPNPQPLGPQTGKLRGNAKEVSHD